MNDYNPPPAFRGFSAKAFAFLKDLADNQDREWFEAHKPIYEREVKEPLARLVVSLGQARAAKNIDRCCDPKRAIFRIHRDVRFSKDKKPYKTNAGATLTRDGEKRSPGVLYIHVDPEGSFAASGILPARAAPAARDPAAYYGASERHQGHSRRFGGNWLEIGAR